MQRVLTSLALILSLAIVGHAQMGSRIRLKSTPVVISGGVGCNAGCQRSTSFTTSEGWSADATQFGTGCGSGFASIQTGFGNNGAGAAVDQSNSTKYCDQVIAAANYASGSGGRGFRHYRGGGAAGCSGQGCDNNSGGGIGVTMPSTNTHLWLSYRVRFASGYGAAPSYAKDVYFHGPGVTYVIPGYQGGGYGFGLNGTYNSGGTSWSSTYSGAANADGSWHCADFEWDITNSIARVWFDGVQTLNTTTLNFGGFTQFQDFEWGENQSEVTTAHAAAPFYTDYDDLKLDNDLTTGQRLGCPGTGG